MSSFTSPHRPGFSSSRRSTVSCTGVRTYSKVSGIGRSVCVTSWGSGYRLGSTMEFSGFDDTLNTRRLAALERGAAEYLHQPVGPEVRERWFGWRPMSVDDIPIIGPVPGRKGLWLATGHGMMGVGMSAATGQLVADLVTGRAPAIDPAPYRVDRLR